MGGKISQSGSCSQDIKAHIIGKAIGAVQKLQSIWSAKDIQVKTKLELYKVLVLSILLYGAETWTLKKEDENRLLVFEMMCLRKIMGVTRRDRIRNTKIRKTLGSELTVLDRVSRKRLLYFGHVQRMPQSRLPKMAFECRIQGTRPRGRPQKRWRDCLLADCTRSGVNSLTDASHSAEDRAAWRTIVMRMPTFSPQLECKA